MVNEQFVKGFKELDEFLKNLPERLQVNVCRGAVRAGAKKGVLPYVRSGVPQHYGKLLQTLKINSKRLDTRVTADITIGDAENYQGYWLEYGVLPHLLEPKHTIFGLGRAPALHIDGEGENLFFAHAHHPGIKARHFMSKAMVVGKDAFVSSVKEYITKRLTKQGIMNADSEANA